MERGVNIGRELNLFYGDNGLLRKEIKEKICEGKIRIMDIELIETNYDED
jgi:hypothetical protein